MTPFQIATKACADCPHAGLANAGGLPVGTACFDCILAAVREAESAAEKREREACAKICEDMGLPEPSDSWTDRLTLAVIKGICDLNAKAVRARGEPHA